MDPILQTISSHHKMNKCRGAKMAISQTRLEASASQG